MTTAPMSEVRRIVLAELEDAPHPTVVLLSSGVDSQLVFAALCEMGYEPWALSFRLDDGREPTDWLAAREAAERYRRPFLDVQLSTDLEELREYVEWAVSFGLTGKAAIECFWPRKAAIDAVASHGAGLTAIATGDGGDGYHVLSKKGMIHYRDTVEKMDEFRRWYFGRANWSQVDSIRLYAARQGLAAFMPLAAPALLDVFLGRSWDECNRPRQKRYLREAFPGLWDLPKHQNLQLGDSGIAELFAGLTPEGARSPVTLYNRLAREAAGALPQGGLF